MEKLRNLIAPAVAIVLWLVITVYQKPHVLFHVPKVGWLLWLGIKGTVPIDDIPAINACVDPAACEWLTKGDVVVDGCSKCGTNWLMTIVHELRTWDKPHLKPFDDILEISPWLELRQFPEDDSERRHETWGHQWNNTELPFKQYKSHCSPHKGENPSRSMVLPVKERPDIKFLVMVRKPEDMFVSLAHFIDAAGSDYENLMGGFNAPKVGLDTLIWFAEKVPGTSLDIYNFFETWYEYRNDPNVLLLHYTEVFQDLPKYIKRISDFLEIGDIPKEAVDEAVRRTSVDFMKIGDRYRGSTGYNHSIKMLKPNKLIREGGLVSKTADITAEQLKRIQKMTNERLNPELAHVLQHGFETPYIKE